MEADNVVSSLEYDSLDRIIRTTMPDGSFYQTGYAAAGANSIQDRSGRTTGITYDSYGRRTAVTDPKSQRTGFAYNLAGDITKLTDANSNQTGWAYDNEGRSIAKTYADGSTYEYTYDKNGELASRKDAKAQSTGYQHDNTGNLTAIDYPNDADISFSYNAFGQKTGMTDAAGSTTWTYSNAGLLLSESTSGGSAPAATVSYSYDSAGRKSSMSVVGQTVSYEYDSASRVSSIRSTVNGELKTFTYSYLGASNKILSISIDGTVIVSNTYDALGRLTKKENKNPDGAPVSSFEYTLNNSDEREDVRLLDSKSIDYSYDLAGQVIGAQKKYADDTQDFSYNYSYNYDPAGNSTSRISQGQSRNYTFNNLNQFLTATSPTATDITGSMIGARDDRCQYKLILEMKR